MPSGDYFFGVFIAQFLETELTSFGDIDGLHLRAEGRLGEIFGVATKGLSAVHDIDLLIEYQVPETAELTAIVGSEMPAYHQANGVVRLTGSPTELLFSEGSSTITGSDLDAQLSNMSGLLTTKDSSQWRHRR